ncbi:gamma-glutamyltransferase family protein [Aurantimonas sp. C2-6-R+9]|uniref:gamma-glutamyltransferase family protein n=2 Tax=Aurantimonas TaxID=182269 RepID=UPI002E1877E1
MQHTAYGLNAAFTAPHRLAAMAGRDVMKAGGTAIEAMVAAAATIATVYPHMNGIGGDAFWLIAKPGQAPVAISSAGRAAALATPACYAENGHPNAIPSRGGLAALTVPGAIDSWRLALEEVAAERRLPLGTLLEDAIGAAEGGIAITTGQSRTTAAKLAELANVPGFAEHYLDGGKVPAPGARLEQKALAETFRHLRDNGLRSYYDGAPARSITAFAEANGSPLRASDFARYRATREAPLHVKTSQGALYNMVAPTQGFASLMILALFDRLGVKTGEGFDHVHGLVEATKQAFILRNNELGDPDTMARPAQDLLDASLLDDLAGRIDRRTALPWPHVAKPGDTIWMGACDADGTVVSFIQSVFFEFGSGVTDPGTGVMLQNRGAGFSLQPGPNQLAPGRRPFHTLNPALAVLKDGRVMAYGNMGGEGQPQTQAAVFTRHVCFGEDLQAAITAPRWLLGKTWGDSTTSLKLESRFDPALVEALRAAGHEVEMIEPFSDLAGHAGAIVRGADGGVQAASDPRADSAALAW